jgi:small-conductance mechanosensitive channel
MRPRATTIFPPGTTILPRLTLIILGLALLATAAPSKALDASSKPLDTAGQATIEEVLAKRKVVAGQIAALTSQRDASATDADPTDVSAAEDELEFLETLDGVYAQQQARFEQRLELQSDKKKADESLAALRKFGPSEAKPYSFLLLESLRDALAAEEDREEAFVADLKAAELLLETAHDNFDEAEKDRRLAQEELTDNEDEEAAGELQSALELAKRQCQIAKELILARRLEVEVRTLRHEVSTTLKEQFSAKVELIGKDVRFTKQDLQDRLKELKDYDTELTKKIAEARSRFQRAETQQAAALVELRKNKAPQSTIALANEAWRVARDGQQMEISLLNERIGDNRRFNHYWACRYEVENGTAKPDQIEEWHESLSDLVDELYDNRRSMEQRIDNARTEQAKIVQQIRNSDDPAVEQWGEAARVHWQQLREVCEEHLVQLNIEERWSDRFLEELHERLEPSSEENWWSVAQQKLSTIWDYEIAEVDDRPITVGKIVILIVYIVLGLLLASVLSRLLGRRLLPRFGLNEGAAHAVQSIAFYALAAVFGVLSFEVVHIPLTAFAFLGGAVAIAIGFGSQDIANNFMSGIILLAEQPIRVGDVVVVDGVQGTVKHIGPRSTRISTDANHEVILPNSKLLSDKVTNLTLSDSLIQTAVGVTLPLKVGVQRAKSILYQAAASHPTVLRTPEPIVLFKQFGALTMDFELHFWLQLTDNMQAAIAQSDVREAIIELFLQCDAQPIIAAIPMSAGAPTGMTSATKAA